MQHLLNKSQVIIHFALGMLAICAISAHAKLPDCTDGFAGVCFYSGNTYKNGRITADIYEGEVKNGLRQGNGTYTFADGKKYIGQFKEDMYFGSGTLIMPDGSRYVGQFKDDQFNGQGTYSWPDNSRYSGQFLNGSFHGKGTYTWSDGKKFVGEWRENRKQGFGILYFANGAIDKQGIYRDDVLVQAQAPVIAPVVPPPAKPVVAPVANPVTPIDQATELKRQKCIKLGLSPGSEDYKQCIK
jgi:hypothetical protein